MLRQKLNRRVVARPLLSSLAPPVADPSLAETLVMLPETQLDSKLESESCEPLPGGSGGEEELDYPTVIDGNSDEVADPDHQESPRSPPLEVSLVERTPLVEKPTEVEEHKQDLFDATEVTTRHEERLVARTFPCKRQCKSQGKSQGKGSKEKKVAAKAKAAAKKALAKAKAALRKAKANATREKNTDEKREKQVAGASPEVEAEVPSPEAKKPRKDSRKSKRAIHKDDDDASVRDASKDATSKPEAPQDTKETKEKETCARRYRPVTESAGQRWDAIKAVFSMDVGPKFHRAASLKD